VLQGREVRKVFLAPAIEVALARNQLRTSKTFDTARLIPIIHRLADPARQGLETWSVIDSSNLKVEATVDAVLAASSA
jgi:hypothetical protein